MSDKSVVPARRGFLKTGAAAATATAILATPGVSRAQTAVFRFQSTWPQRDIFHEFAQDYVTRVNAMGGGRLRLELLAAGSVVGAFQVLDAVHAGHLDVEDHQVGLERPHEFDGLVASTGLADHVVALFFQGFAQVHADDGLVFGDHDTQWHGPYLAGDGRDPLLRRAVGHQ